MPDDDRIGGRRAPRTTARIPYVWVEDTTTGHRYDVLETALRDGMKPVEGYDLNYTGRPRRTKHRTDLAGESATGQRAAHSAAPVEQPQPTDGQGSEPAADKTTSLKGGRR
ncbi:hypothetical protein GCM10011608_09930 [Micromonospora sonchi]|uniref:Uncharacterized protein n=1 Tax=Micromonospora sonchi TaxID=1763543 RepID=A0A917TKS5_9ACTN|nr:hypothetical protein [Micromonospora sonchi]GGM27143.1 hypothetical protein GCM10011608_09930 [Micromonospora sonchi]